MDGQTNTELEEVQSDSTSIDSNSDVASSSMQEAFERHYQNDSPATETLTDEPEQSIEPMEESTIDSNIEAGDGYSVPPTSVEEIDVGSRKKAFLDNLGVAAAQSAKQIFEENGVQMIKVLDLYEKDDRGYVRFVNPDDPNRPFASREEAQKWCDSFNNTVALEFKETVNSERRRLINEYQPTLQLYDFINDFAKYSRQKQDLVNELVSPYAITNRTGEIIGYNCDLKAAAKQADSIIKKFGKTQTPKPKQEVSEPALDIAATGASQAKRKPASSLQEAMENYYQDKERKK